MVDTYYDDGEAEYANRQREHQELLAELEAEAETRNRFLRNRTAQPSVTFTTAAEDHFSSFRSPVFTSEEINSIRDAMTAKKDKKIKNEDRL